MLPAQKSAPQFAASLYNSQVIFAGDFDIRNKNQDWRFCKNSTVEWMDSRGFLDSISVQLLKPLYCYVAFDACSIWSTQILS